MCFSSAIYVIVHVHPAAVQMQLIHINPVISSLLAETRGGSRRLAEARGGSRRLAVPQALFNFNLGLIVCSKYVMFFC